MKLFLLSGKYKYIDQISVSGGNFLTIIICAALLDTLSQGVFVYLFSIYFLFLLFSIALIYAPLTVAYKGGEDVERLLSISYFLHLTFTVCMVILYLIIGQLIGFDIGGISGIFYFVLFLFFQQTADYGRRSSYIFWSEAQAVSISLVNYVSRISALLVFQPNAIEEVLLILAVTSFAPSLIVLFKVKRVKIVKKYKYYFAFIKLSRNIFLSVPAAWSTAYAPIFVLGFVKGLSMVAILGTFKSITNMANVFLELVEVSYIPLWKRNMHKKKEKVKREIRKIILFFSLLWSIVLALYLYLLEYLYLIINNDYLGYSYILTYLWIAYYFYFLGRLTVLYFRVYDNTIIELIMSYTRLFYTLLLIPLIYMYGIDGAATVFILVPIFSLLTVVIYINQKRLLDL